MKRCEECGQEKLPDDNDILAARIDCYRGAWGMLKDLTGGDPPEWQVLRAARFLAAEPPDMSDALVDMEDDNDD